jgi:hypothetical protein
MKLFPSFLQQSLHIVMKMTLLTVFDIANVCIYVNIRQLIKSPSITAMQKLGIII